MDYYNIYNSGKSPLEVENEIRALHGMKALTLNEFIAQEEYYSTAPELLAPSECQISTELSDQSKGSAADRSASNT